MRGMLRRSQPATKSQIAEASRASSRFQRPGQAWLEPT